MPPKEIQFPAAGVHRRIGLRDTTGNRGPFPTPWSMNVRLEDDLTNRLRGGSFSPSSAGARPSEIRYRDRVLTFSSNAITATRMGDDTDTDLDSDVSDTMRAALFQFSYGGAVGATIVALVPHKDQFLLGFTATETWVQRGDPHTGSRRRVSDEVGIIGADAWCMAHDTCYYLSSRGLYSVNADGSDFKAISEDVIPEHLIGLTDTAATLTYEHATRGVYIHLTSGNDWFYDIARQGFWPISTSSTSHVLLGPLRLGGPDKEGLIQTLHGVMASGSATVNWRIVPGETAEEAAANGKLAITAEIAGSSFAAYTKAQGSWTAGLSQTARPRVTAMFACVWLSSSGTWAFEGLTMNVIPAGMWR